MDLNNLRKQLYKKNAQIGDRPKAPEEFELGHAAPRFGGAPQWNDEKSNGFFLTIKRKRKIWLAAIFFVLVFLGLTSWFYWAGKNSFAKEKVSLDIFGQERIVSGEEVKYIVRYKNNTDSILQNADLVFLFSEQSIPSDKSSEKSSGLPSVKKNIGDIAAGQEGQMEFQARVLGDKDSAQKFSAKLEYTPLKFNSLFVNEAEFSSLIISVPLVLSFDLPERIVSGQVLNFALKYLNTSDAIFSDSKIKIEFPGDFKFENAVPSPSENSHIWNLPEIGSHEEGKILIKGIVIGNEGERKVFKAQIGSEKNNEFSIYAQALSSSGISVSPLFIEQVLSSSVKSSFNLGEVVNYKIKYRNTTDFEISPVVISLKINSQAVDYQSIDASGGFFSSSENTIIWNASSLPALNLLAAHSEGELEFSLKIKDILPINNFSDKNFSVVTIAQIDSPNVPLALTGTQLAGRNQMDIKINSNLVLNVKGYYFDKIIQNSGALPPRIGLKTTYTIYFQVLNVSNELSDAIVETYLPSYIQWQGNIYPKNENISYDQATGKVVWKIGRLPAATGILMPVKQVAFQIGFVPSLGQVGSVADLVKESKISGKDNFTEENLSVIAPILNSSLPDDSGVGYEKGRVGN